MLTVGGNVFWESVYIKMVKGDEKYGKHTVSVGYMLHHMDAPPMIYFLGGHLIQVNIYLFQFLTIDAKSML